MKRLASASQIASAKSAEALVVVVADAADNSITAAETQSERSFIQDLLFLGDLPSNVRLLVTSRTGRLESLNLPPRFGMPMEIRGFSRAETAAYVRSFWNNPPESWIDDFQYLSDGNPRVQSYSLSCGKGEPDRALEYLRPHGKSLDNVFDEQFDQARTKFGAQLDVKMFCATLIALPRPVPLVVLSVVSSSSEWNLKQFATGFRRIEFRFERQAPRRSSCSKRFLSGHCPPTESNLALDCPRRIEYYGLNLSG